MIFGNQPTRESTDSRSRCPLAVILHRLDTLYRSVLQHYGLAGLLSKRDARTQYHRADYQQNTNCFHFFLPEFPDSSI
jgi:hypothetical protein